jgi:hypothetical protein
MQDRRKGKRLEAWVPMRLQTEGSHRFAVSCNLSTRGMLLATATTLEPDAHVSVRVRGENGRSQTLNAAVVRVDPNRDEEREVWPYRVAIRFLDDDEEVRTVLEQLGDGSWNPMPDEPE